MEFEYLANHEYALPTIAEWYFKEWGHIQKGNSLEKTIERLQTYLNTDKIPLALLAIDSGKILGVAHIKFREMDIFPEKEHWLGGVYVSEKHRGQNIAKQIIHRIISKAKQLDVKTLYLQTEDKSGGLYSELGWQPVEQVTYKGVNVLVMEKEI